jgi:hypothetical protein
MPCIVITPPSRLPMRRRRRWHRPPQSCHRRQPFISRHHPSTAVQSHLLSGCLLVTVAETRLCRVSSSLRRRTMMDGIFPRRRRDGDGCGDAAVPSDRRRRRLRRGRGTTRRDERGGGRRQGTSVRRRQPVKARRCGARGIVEMREVWWYEFGWEVSDHVEEVKKQKNSATFFTSATFLGSGCDFFEHR